LKIRLKYIGLGETNLPKYLELPEGTDIEGLIHFLKDRIEAPLEYLFKSTFLVNNSKAHMNTVLKDGDEVLILHPLGGG